MTTNKPEVVAWYFPSSKTTLPVVSLNARSGNGQLLIRLSDYERLKADHERLQAECDKLRKDAERYRYLLEEPVGYVSPRLLDTLRSGKACGITLEDKPDAHNGVTMPLYAAECGCCGQTYRCDDDCDAVAIGGHRAAEQQPPADGSLTPVPDELFAAEFNAWWEQHGQFCRAGGSDYERTFAFEAWRHLYPKLMKLQKVAAEQQPGVTQLVGALEAVMEFGCDPESNRGMWALEKARSALAAYHKGGDT